MSATELIARLEPSERELLARCGELAEERGERAFLVGGSVRDLVLKRAQTDLDVVVEGDGMALAQAVARDRGGTLTRHHAFQTARVDTPDGLRLDVATARREDYPRPGQLPQVVPGALEDDLRRRDFTINTMAIDLSPAAPDELVDPLDGMRDLEAGVIRVIHARSFADDPTRVLRALRFAMRFQYAIEDETETWLDEAVAGGYLDTVSGDRIRRELEYMLGESPVSGPVRLQEMGVLAAIHESLAADREALERLQAVETWWHEESSERGSRSGDPAPPWAIVLAACAREMGQQDRWGLVRRLKLSREERTPLVDSGAPWDKALSEWASRPDGPAPASRIEQIFRSVGEEALILGLAFDAPSDEELDSAVRSYLKELRWVHPELDGSDLRELGVPEGPGLGEMLERLRAERLDGAVTSADEERRLVTGWLANKRRD